LLPHPCRDLRSLFPNLRCYRDIGLLRGVPWTHFRALQHPDTAQAPIQHTHIGLGLTRAICEYQAKWVKLPQQQSRSRTRRLLAQSQSGSNGLTGIKPVHFGAHLSHVVRTRFRASQQQTKCRTYSARILRIAGSYIPPPAEIVTWLVTLFSDRTKQ
jgi:hypothetical protein